MFGFNRRVRVAFADVVTEPSSDDLMTEVRIVQLDEEALLAKRKGDREAMDAALDKRLTIREPRPASVPVVPGRAS